MRRKLLDVINDFHAVESQLGGYITVGLNEFWFKDGLLHREDGPASIRPTLGLTAWYREGLLHREDGPAILRYNGSQKWYRNGALHRTDGPAVTDADGSMGWFVDGTSYQFTEWCNKVGIDDKLRVSLILQYGLE